MGEQKTNGSWNGRDGTDNGNGTTGLITTNETNMEGDLQDARTSGNESSLHCYTSGYIRDTEESSRVVVVVVVGGGGGGGGGGAAAAPPPPAPPAVVVEVEAWI